jgi:hypothetical protein
MASKVIYPPIVDSYLPAFNADIKDVSETVKCKIPFRLSKFNSSSDIKSVHISIVKQNTGKSVVNINNNSDGRYRATGIILNAKPVQDTSSGEDDLYYVYQGGAQSWQPNTYYEYVISEKSVNVTPPQLLSSIHTDYDYVQNTDPDYDDTKVYYTLNSETEKWEKYTGGAEEWDYEHYEKVQIKLIGLYFKIR